MGILYTTPLRLCNYFYRVMYTYLEMRRISTILFLMLIFLLLSLTPILAQEDHTAREEREGKAIWDKLKSKQLECKNLNDDNYASLGEYFMGQMVGDSHEVMNNMMTKMMGEKGEDHMHVVMGKRLSGCDTSASFPQQGLGFMPMMGMMMGSALSRSTPGFGGSKGGGSPMMGFGNMMGWGGFGFFGLIFWLFWVVVLIDLILLGIWFWKKIKKEK